MFLLVGIAGTLGYWYRDIFEPPVVTHQTQTEKSSSTKISPQALPVESEILTTPTPEPLNNQESPSEPTDVLNK